MAAGQVRAGEASREWRESRRWIGRAMRWQTGFVCCVLMPKRSKGWPSLCGRLRTLGSTHGRCSPDSTFEQPRTHYTTRYRTPGAAPGALDPFVSCFSIRVVAFSSSTMRRRCTKGLQPRCRDFDCAVYHSIIAKWRDDGVMTADGLYQLASAQSRDRQRERGPKLSSRICWESEREQLSM